MTLTLQWLLDKANRKLNVEGMHPQIVQRVRQVITDLHMKGIYVCVAQGFRSKAEQDALYAQGRTKPGKIVTNAKGGQSNHNYGVAVDLCLYTDDGKDVKWQVAGDFQKVVAAMKAKGFGWGGDWKGFKDYPHFELYDAVNGEKAPNDAPVSAPSTPLPPGIIGVVRAKLDDVDIILEASRDGISIEKAVKGRMYNVTANIKDYHRVILDDHRQGWIKGENGKNLELLR